MALQAGDKDNAGCGVSHVIEVFKDYIRYYSTIASSGLWIIDNPCSFKSGFFEEVFCGFFFLVLGFA